jgi:hypothetical protein
MKKNIQINTTIKDITSNKSMDNQDDNQKKLPVPKHLTDREKANLMVAWARTHNKIDREAGTITYPSGAVGKLKPKKEEKQETPPQDPTEDNQPVVSKMEQMTPRERANHDWKLNLLKKASQMNKDDEQNTKEAIQPNLFEDIEETEDLKPKNKTKLSNENFLDVAIHIQSIDTPEEPLKTEKNNISIKGLDPEKMAIGAKLISLYTKAEIYKFSDIFEDAYANMGDELKDIFTEIKAVYASYRETADDDTYAKLDKNIRDYTFASLINKINNDEQVKNTPIFTPLWLEHYSQIVKDHLKQHHKKFYRTKTYKELRKIAPKGFLNSFTTLATHRWTRRFIFRKC